MCAHVAAGAADGLPSPEVLEDFSHRVFLEGARLYRDLPWRRTRDPYAVLVSEVMLQQTQVSRVDGRWQRWMARFPEPAVLADATSAEVLSEWQGLGYNRRALALHAAAKEITRLGRFPREEAELVVLPGVGRATASGVRAFAFDLPGVYLETNVRAVFLHEFFPEAEGVSDRVLVPLVEATCPKEGAPEDRGPRSWYFALLDLGAELKRVLPNPSRRSATSRRQSPFEGSRRQKRAELLRRLLEAREVGLGGLTLEDATLALARFEEAHGRPAPPPGLAEELLAELSREGFCEARGDLYRA